MKIRRFVAKDMRSALTQIKEELGPDAVIMSNKKIPEGVELMAAVDYSQSLSSDTPEVKKTAITHNNAESTLRDNITAPSLNTKVRAIDNDVVTLGQNQSSPSAKPIPANSAQSNKEKSPFDSLSALLNRQVQNKGDQGNANSGAASITASLSDESAALQEKSIEQQFKQFTARLQQGNGDNSSIAEQPQPESLTENGINTTPSLSSDRQIQENDSLSSIRSTANKVVSLNEFENMQKEMASIRQLLEHQVSGLMWQDMAQKDPKRAVLVNRLMALGLTEKIADQIAGYIPHQTNEDDAWQQALLLISQQLNTTNNDIIQRGGVVALVGPTGVGKTTTIAKLAARFAQIHGADQVALISTDTFRIAGFEQLATYGKIIGCQVKLAKDAQALDHLLQQYSKKKLILIDTAGMGQRDLRLAEHLSTLISNARVRIRNYLVIAANTQQRVMQENVDRFKKVPLSGSIYTKLDESVSIGEILSTSIQNGLPIGYLTDGQRVPEDIKVANAVKLVNLADKMASKSSLQYCSSERAMPVTHSKAI